MQHEGKVIKRKLCRTQRHVFDSTSLTSHRTTPALKIHNILIHFNNSVKLMVFYINHSYQSKSLSGRREMHTN